MNQTRFKVVLVGDASVGKTSILNRYANITSAPAPTISASSIPFDVKVGETTVGLNMWDTAGQEAYKCLVPIYARGSKVAIVVYDQSCRESFNNIEKWIKYLKEDIGVQNILVVGNKEDLTPTVTFEEANQWCTERGYELISTSAETGINIDLLFHTIATKLLTMDTPTNTSDDKITFGQQQESKTGCC